MYDYFYNYAEDLMYKYDPKIYPYPGYFVAECFHLSKNGFVKIRRRNLFGFFNVDRLTFFLLQTWAISINTHL